MHRLPTHQRHDGLDLARFLAFLGMVLVNFQVAASAMVMPDAPTFLTILHQGLEGRAAALFVLLAGVGVGLGFVRRSLDDPSGARQAMLKRGLVLFGFGLVNLLVFEADILHFYGLYFLFAAFLLPLSRRVLLVLAFGLIMTFPLLGMLLDYGTGWDWQALSYRDFWTLAGFVRHSLFNGWHPVLPWLAFLLMGMAVAQLDLNQPMTRLRIGGAGGMLMVASWFFASAGDDLAQMPEVVADKELVDALSLFFSLSPIPPAPLYMLSATGSSLLMLALCLWIAQRATGAAWLKPLLITGQQALTLYIAHILIGMGLMELIGWTTEDSAKPATSLTNVTLWALGFTLISIVFANLWKRRFGAGPLERLLRRLSH